MLVYATPGWSLASQFEFCSKPPAPPPKSRFFRGQKNWKFVPILIFILKTINFCFWYRYIYRRYKISAFLFFGIRKLSRCRPRLSRTTSGPSKVFRPRPIDCEWESEKLQLAAWKFYWSTLLLLRVWSLPPFFCLSIANNNVFFHPFPDNLVTVASRNTTVHTPQKKPIAGFSWTGGHFSRDK